MIREILVALAVVLAFLSGFLAGIYYTEAFVSTSASVYAAAVTSEGGGALVEITARLAPGYGRVFVSVEPKTQLDTQQSAEIAVYVAQRLAGQPLGFRDVLFTIKAPSAIVGGPSAGAAMTVAAYGALTGKEPSKDVVVTGTINYDGSIGPVGGLVKKLEACAKHGIKYFLIPKGERYFEVVEPVEQVYSPLPGMTVVRKFYRRKVVDLVALGKELGVTVVEVSNINDVLPFFFKSRTSS